MQLYPENCMHEIANSMDTFCIFADNPVSADSYFLLSFDLLAVDLMLQLHTLRNSIVIPPLAVLD